MNKTIIIAEAGVNHNGNVSIAKKMIDIADDAGADYIKFQTAVPELMITDKAPKAKYQNENTGSDETQLDMIKRITLSYNDFRHLCEYCRQKRVKFLSTPFDENSIEFLQELEMPIWKIPSGEITNYPYLVRIAATKKPIIMSTGMCTMKEIEHALMVLRNHGAEDITLLHCNTSYPTPYRDANIRAMITLRKEFHTEIGYSDHTLGIEVPIAAVAMGASVIEKHFTIDRNMEGPDHKASLEPDELKTMINSIRNIEQAMGDGIKKPTSSEKANIAVARKSIVASCAIKSGDTFTDSNLTAKRPGTGISPMRWNDVVGTSAKRDYMKDELIEL